MQTASLRRLNAVLLAVVIAVALISVLGLSGHAHATSAPGVGTPKLTTIEFGPPITTTRLKKWQVPATMFRFREVPPSGNVITALQAAAAAAAHYNYQTGGYILAVRFGVITAPSWRTPSGLVLDHKRVWLVVYADSPVPGTFCAGVGKRFTPVNPLTSRVWTDWAVAHCQK